MSEAEAAVSQQETQHQGGCYLVSASAQGPGGRAKVWWEPGPTEASFKLGNWEEDVDQNSCRLLGARWFPAGPVPGRPQVPLCLSRRAGASEILGTSSEPGEAPEGGQREREEEWSGWRENAITASGEAGVPQSGSEGGGSGERFPVCADCERDRRKRILHQQQLGGEAASPGRAARCVGAALRRGSGTLRVRVT